MKREKKSCAREGEGKREPQALWEIKAAAAATTTKTFRCGRMGEKVI